MQKKQFCFKQVDIKKKLKKEKQFKFVTIEIKCLKKKYFS